MKKIKLLSVIAMLLFAVTLTSCNLVMDDPYSDDCKEHLWGEYEVTLDATCQVEGLKVRKCTNCDKTETVQIAKVDHAYTNYVNSEIICTEATTATASCDYGCGTQDTKVIAPATGHSHVELSRIEASCTENGEVVYTCSCGDSYTEVLVATGHKYDLVAEVEVSCTTDGSKAYECVCGDSYTLVVKATGHSHALVTEVEADCENDGQKVFECICGDSYTETVLAYGHNYLVNNKIELSCTTDEKTTYICEHCKDVYEEVTVYATGHNVSKWELDSETTLKDCHVEQHYLGTCLTCLENIEKNETVVKHTYTDNVEVTVLATCQTNGVKTYYCECGAKEEVKYVNEDAHNWVADTSIVSARTNSSVSYHCSNEGCTETKSEIIIDDTKGSVSKENLASSGVALSNATISLDENTLNGLADEDVTLTAEILSGDDLAAIKEKLGDKASLIGDNQIYNFGLSQSGAYIEDEFGGYVTVTVEYVLAEGEDPESIAIWYVDQDGNVETIKAVYSNGTATFKVKHFSYYTVTRLSAKERCALYGHVYNDIVVEATCTEGGYTLHVCQRCGESSKDELKDALGHNTTSVVTLPTCTKNGKEVHTCQNEGCKYSYTTVVIAVGHQYNTTTIEASCLVDGSHTHTCTNENCNYSYVERIPATGHKYAVEVIEATCLEKGVKTYTCLCGDTYQAVILATGHKWTVLEKVPATKDEEGYIHYGCAHCDEEYIEVLPKSEEVSSSNLDILIGAFESLLNQKMTLVLSNVYVKVTQYGPVADDGNNKEQNIYTIEYLVDELYLTLNENDELVGSGVIVGIMNDNGEVIEQQLEIYIHNLTAYTKICAEDEEQVAVANLEALISSEMEDMPIDMIAAVLEMTQTWYDESFYEIVDSLVEVNGEATLEVLETIVNNVFNFEETESGYNISLNITGLNDVVVFLKENTIYDVIESIVGYEVLENLDLIFDFNVSDLIDFLAEKGLVLEDVIASLDDLVVIMAENGMVPEDISTLNELIAVMTGSEEVNILEMIESEDVQNITVGDLVLLIISSANNSEQGSSGSVEDNSGLVEKEEVATASEETTVTIADIKSMIYEALENFKSYTILEMLAGNMGFENVEDVVSMLKELVTTIDESFKVNVCTDQDGNVIDSTLIVDFDFEDVVVSLTVGLDNDYEVVKSNEVLEVEFNKLWKELDVVGNIEVILDYFLVNNSSYTSKNYELIYNEAGEVESVQIIIDQIHYLPSDGGNVNGTREVYTFDIEALDNYLFFTEQSACSNWSKFYIGINARRERFTGYYEVTSEDEIVKFNLVEVYDSESGSYQYQIAIYYNKLTKQFTDSTTASHNTVYNEEKSTIPVGCTDKGIRYYECTKCDYYYTSTYTKGHNTKVAGVSLVGETCEDGVMIEYACENCDHTYAEEVYYHYQYETVIDLTQYGATCYSEIVINQCACGENYYQHFNSKCDFDCETLYYNDWCDYLEVYICAVTNPACGFKYAVLCTYELNSYCEVICTETMYFGVEKVTYNQETNEALVEGAKYTMSRTFETGNYQHNYETTVIENSETVYHYINKCHCGYTYESKNVYDDSRRIVSTFYEYYYPERGYAESYTYEYAIYNDRSYITLNRYASNGYWRLYTYTYDFVENESCTRLVVYTNSNGEHNEYTEECCNYMSEGGYVETDHPCTQSHYEYKNTYCIVCGKVEDSYYYESEPKGHSYYWDETLQVYVCSTCGLQNANGADGSIILEDCTEEGSDVLTVGYYNRDKIEYVLSVSIILSTPDADGNNEVFINGVDFNYLAEGRYVSFSKEQVIKLASELGYNTDEYNIRLSFVPTNGADELDYAITFE